MELATGFSANVLEVQIAKAAQAALTAGRDPYEAAQARYKQMRGEAKGPEGETPDKRRYLLAVCRLGSGQFEHLSDDDLTDVAALVKLPFHGPDDWADIRERA